MVGWIVQCSEHSDTEACQPTPSRFFSFTWNSGWAWMCKLRLDIRHHKIWYISGFAFSMIISLVLLQFINILLSCGHFISSSVISCTVDRVSFLRISAMVTSSINFWRRHCIIKLLMKAINVSGPSQVPWNTPPLRMTQSEKLPLTLIFRLRSRRKELTHFTMKLGLGMPKEMSLFSNTNIDKLVPR